MIGFFLRRVFRSYIVSVEKGQEYREIHDQSGDIICMHVCQSVEAVLQKYVVYSICLIESCFRFQGHIIEVCRPLFEQRHWKTRFLPLRKQRR